MDGVALAILLVCLVLPALAIARLPLDPRLAVGYPVAISVLTYWIYARDKRHAQLQEWRVPESTLHLLELLGGWPGAFVAQRRLRHKCSKRSYQIVFGGIVLIHEWAAVEVMWDGGIGRAITQVLRANGLD